MEQPNVAHEGEAEWRRESAADVLEVAVLDVKPGAGAAFERAFGDAQRIIASMPGYRRHELRRCLERGERYLLLVWWDSLEAHTEGFRRSPEYARWKALLHHFYDPFPTVEHYAPMAVRAARTGARDSDGASSSKRRPA
jgi:heme-degrading monooxygenase HmoA